MTKKGVITSGSPNVYINGKPAAMATDSTVKCSDDGSQQMAEGSRGSLSTPAYRGSHHLRREGDDRFEQRHYRRRPAANPAHSV
jgi:hypothetical protein